MAKKTASPARKAAPKKAHVQKNKAPVKKPLVKAANQVKAASASPKSAGSKPAVLKVVQKASAKPAGKAQLAKETGLNAGKTTDKTAESASAKVVVSAEAPAKKGIRPQDVAAAAKATAQAQAGIVPGDPKSKKPKSERAARKARERMEFLLLQRAPSPEDVEARRNTLKSLITLGKERGFLTYAEVNDYLPDDVVDAEQIEAIISTFSDMGISVYDQAPDAETLLLNENAPASTTSSGR